MKYEIIRSDRKTLSLQVKDGQLIVRAPETANLKSIEKFVSDNHGWVEKALRKSRESRDKADMLGHLTQDDIRKLAGEALEVIPQRVEYYAKIIGVTYGRITIRNQRTRWGSCTAEGNLNFNCLLMLAPPQVIDSVVVHELCHRKQMNHSRAFYAEVYKAFPEYDKWNNWLKKNGRVLLARML